MNTNPNTKSVVPAAPVVWGVKLNNIEWMDGEFDTKEEAQAYIDNWWNKVKGTDSEKYFHWKSPKVDSHEMHNSVYRLNTLLSESDEKVKELEKKLAIFKTVHIGWTCTGHTRAQWQTAADVEWVRKNRPQWSVEDETWSLTVSINQ